EGRIYVLLWFFPFVVFLFGRNKDIRFTAPLLPAVAILLAWMIDSVLSFATRWLNLGVPSLVLAFPLLAYRHTSFALLETARFGWGELVLLAPRLTHAVPPDPRPWPQQEILKVLRMRSDSAATPSVMLGTDTLHFNANNFELAATAGLYPFQVSTSA